MLYFDVRKSLSQEEIDKQEEALNARLEEAFQSNTATLIRCTKTDFQVDVFPEEVQMNLGEIKEFGKVNKEKLRRILSLYVTVHRQSYNEKGIPGDDEFYLLPKPNEIGMYLFQKVIVRESTVKDTANVVQDSTMSVLENPKKSPEKITELLKKLLFCRKKQK